MNGTWLAFMTLLIVALIAVAMGAQQIEAQQAQEINQLVAQRDVAVKVALEANKQRDNAFLARDEAIAKWDGLNAEISALQNDLHDVQMVADNRQQEIDRLVREANELHAQVQNLKAQNLELEAQFANQPQGPMPVTGYQEAASKNSCTTAETNGVCLPVQSKNLTTQLGIGLALLIGMAALGSGGYLYYRHDPERKYSVKMTKDQIREYARYKHERGNRAV